MTSAPSSPQSWDFRTRTLAGWRRPRDPLSLRLPIQVDRFELLREIQCGGFGRVYEARDQRPTQQRAAIKVIDPRLLPPQTALQSFAEARALGTLQHQNIVKVLDAGTFVHEVDGRPLDVPWIAMELLSGVDVCSFATRQRLTFHKRLDLFVRVVAGVARAHGLERPIVHGDIKPSNVIMDGTGSDPEDTPRLIDFGLTVEGEADSSPGYSVAYASPEQLEGSPPGVRSDVYSLGVLGFQLVAEHLPYELGDGPFEAIQFEADRVSARRRAKIRKLPESPGPHPKRGERVHSLDLVLQKALAHHPTDRYSDARELLKDLLRVQRSQRTSVHPNGVLHRLRFLAWQRRVTVAIGLILLSGIVATSGALRAALVALGARDVALGKAEQEATAARTAEGVAREAERRAANEAVAARKAEGLAQASEQLAKERGMESARRLVALLRRQARAHHLAREHPQAALYLAEALVLAEEHRFPEVSFLRTSLVGTLDTPPVLRRVVRHVVGAQFLGQETVLTQRIPRYGLEGYFNQQLKTDSEGLGTLDIRTGVVTTHLGMQGHLYKGHSAQQILVSEGFRMSLVDVADPRHPRILFTIQPTSLAPPECRTDQDRFLSGAPGFVRFTGDGQKLVAVSATTARVFSCETGEPHGQLAYHSPKPWTLAGSVMLHDVAISSDGEEIATIAEDGTARVFGAASGKARITFECGGELASEWDYSKRIQLLTPSIPPEAQDAPDMPATSAGMYDPPSGRYVVNMRDASRPVCRIWFDRDGQRLTTLAAGWIKQWQVSSGESATEGLGGGNVIAAIFNADRTRLATAHATGTVTLWTWPEAKQVGVLVSPDGPVRHMLYSPDSCMIFICSDLGVGRIWRTDLLRQVGGTMPHHTGVAYSQFSDNGRVLLTISEDAILRTWHLDGRNHYDVALKPLDHTIQSADFSPDGSSIVAATESECGIWHSDRGERRHLMPELRGASWVGFTSSGESFAVVTPNEIAIRDARTALPQREPISLDERLMLEPLMITDAQQLLARSGAADLLVAWDLRSGARIQLGLSDWLQERKIGKPRLLDVSRDGQWAAVRGLTPYQPAANREQQATYVGGVFTKHTGYPPPGSTGNASLTRLGPKGDRSIVVYDGNEAAISLKGAFSTRFLRLTSTITEVVFSDDGNLALLLMSDGTARKCESNESSLKATEISFVPAPTERVIGARFSQDNRYVFTTSNELLRCWDASTGDVITTVDIRAADVADLHYDPTTQTLRIMSRSGRLITCALVTTTRSVTELRTMAEFLSGQSVSPGGDPVQLQPFEVRDRAKELLQWNATDPMSLPAAEKAVLPGDHR